MRAPSAEQGKVLGSAVAGPHIVQIDGADDDVDRLCTQAGEPDGRAFANIDPRSESVPCRDVDFPEAWAGGERSRGRRLAGRAQGRT